MFGICVFEPNHALGRVFDIAKAKVHSQAVTATVVSMRFLGERRFFEENFKNSNISVKNVTRSVSRISSPYAGD